MDPPTSGSSWLSSLPSHPIFSPTASSSAGLTASSSSALAAPASPNASSIHDHDDDAEESGFTTFLADAQYDADAGDGHTTRRSVACIIRKSELAVAFKNQVRLTSLASFKASLETPSTARNPHIVKRLNTPIIQFDIYSLVPSLNDRFLACVGRSQLVVLEVPRKGWDGLLSTSLECSHDPIGPFYHTASSASIAKVAWHHWGEKDATLLVLTSDGLLREYNVLADTEEPTQVVDFVGQGSRGPLMRAQSSRSPSRSSTLDRKSEGRAISSTDLDPRPDGRTPVKAGKRTLAYWTQDDDAATAVSFAFACDNSAHNDWGPFTVYCVMRNGDLYSICPYLPERSQIPLSTLLALNTSILEKLKSTEGGNDDARHAPTNPYAPQSRFLNALLAQRTLDLEDSESDFSNKPPNMEETISVRSPAYLQSSTMARQGPYRFSPTPQELDNQQESRTCDLTYVVLSAVSSAANAEMELDPGNSPQNLGVLVFAHGDGRVDVCLEMEPPEAKWTGLAGTQSVGGPTIFTYQCIDLFKSASIASSTMSIVRDADDPTTLYLYHLFGVHSVSLEPMRETLFPKHHRTTSRQDEQQQAKQMLRQQSLCQASCIFRGSSSRQTSKGRNSESSVVYAGFVSDVYLGYLLLLLTDRGQLVPIELASPTYPGDRQRGPTKSLSHPESKLALTNGSMGSERPSYAAFSDSQPLILPHLLVKGTTSPMTRLASPPASSNNAKVSAEGSLELTIESLRFVGQTVERLDSHIKELIQAGNVVQERLELHLGELPRQVGKLQNVEGSLREKEQVSREDHSRRLSKVITAQQALEKRSDRLLQCLIDRSQPELSAFEQQWIEELHRVYNAVEGSKSSGRMSLQTRVARLGEQVKVLKPQLQQVSLSVLDRVQEEQRIGGAQRQAIEAALAEETRLLNLARGKIERISSRMSKSGQISKVTA